MPASVIIRFSLGKKKDGKVALYIGAEITHRRALHRYAELHSLFLTHVYLSRCSIHSLNLRTSRCRDEEGRTQG